MANIRGASLGAHAAARKAKENEAACFVRVRQARQWRRHTCPNMVTAARIMP